MTRRLFIPKDSAAHVIPFVQDSVEPGAQVRTDGSAAYRSLKELGYEHQRTVMLGSDAPAHVSMAGVPGGGSGLKAYSVLSAALAGMADNVATAKVILVNQPPARNGILLTGPFVGGK